MADIHGQRHLLAMPKFDETDAKYYYDDINLPTTPSSSAAAAETAEKELGTSFVEKRSTHHHKLSQYKEILLKLEKDKYIRDDERKRLR